MQRVCLGFIVFALALGCLSAQTPTGTLQGTITDASGALVPGAKVVITNIATNERKQLTTDDEGRYLQPFLLAGDYSVTVEKAGFQALRQEGIHLDVGQNRSVDLGLTVGAVSQEIRVESTPPQVDVNTSSVGQVIENKRIMDLPLNGRGVFNLANLTPGVNPTGGGATPGIAGGRNAMSEIQIDGMTDIAPENNVGINNRIYDPQVDAVAEFSVQVNSLAAEYGRFAGGVINVSTKSGTNQLHGTAYDYLRNAKLNANGYNNNRNNRPRTGSVTNQWGYTVGGPIYLPGVYEGRNKSFFFNDFEGTNARNQASATATVPLAEWKAGNFSNLMTSAGVPIIIYDPLTGRVDPANPARFIRDPFAGNTIDPTRIDPVARAMAAYWPSPNNTPTNVFTQQNNFASSGGSKSDSYRLDTRWDENWTEKWRMFARVSVAWNQSLPFNGFGTLGTSSGDGPNSSTTRNVSLDHTYTINSSTIANVRYGFSRTSFQRVPFSDGIDLTQLGFPASYAATAARNGLEFPNIGISGNLSLNGLGQATFTRLFQHPMVHSLTGSMTKLTSAHSIKFGGEFRKLMINFAQYGQPSGTYSFNAAWTQQEINTTSSTAGAGLASYLLGLPSGGSMSHDPSAASSSDYWAAYIQDDWKITRKLTLNLGLRYDVDIPRTERFNQYSFFDINAVSPLQGVIPASACLNCGNLKGGMNFVSPSNRHQTPTDWNDFGPRIGFAYNLAPKTVLRGAYGISYAPSALQAAGTSGTAGMEGFNSSTGVNSSFDSNRTVFAFLRNPFPTGFNLPTGTSLGARTNLGLGVGDSFFNAYHTPYVQQWNANVQRSLPGNMVAEVGYLGNRGIDLVDGETGWQYNQLPASYLSLGTALQDKVANPFFGMIPYTTGALAQPTVNFNQLLRPYPQYTSLQSFRKPTANSIYHGMTVRVDKRFSSGMSLLFAYTASKAIDNASSAVNFLGGIAGTHLDFYNQSLERSLSSFDVSQRAVFSYVYELPFGKGKPVLNHLPRGLNMLATGWQVNGITTFQKGLPLIIGGVTNNTNIFTSSQRANNNGTSAFIDHSGQTHDQMMVKWFDPAVFSQPAAFTLGNLGRTLPDVRAPGINSTDLSAFKNSYFGTEHRYNLQYRVEAFSAFNHLNLSAPATAINSGTIGTITGGSGTRNVQMALKLLW
jgi:hypothetical protein